MINSAKHGRRFSGTGDRLRSPERIALLEVQRVVALCVEGLAIKHVLDVGTGSGVFAEAFCKLALAVTGIDTNAELLCAARDHAPKTEMIEATAERMPFADGSFDLVFLGHVLHETDIPLIALKEGRRVARARVAVLEWPYREEERGPPLEHRLKPEAIEDFARKAGFQRIERIKLEYMDFYRFTP